MGDFFPHSRYNQLRPNIQLCILFLVESIEMKKNKLILAENYTVTKLSDMNM